MIAIYKKEHNEPPAYFLIRNVWDFVDWIWQYELFSLTSYLRGKIISKTWVRYKNMKKGKTSVEKPLSTISNLHANCHIKP